MTEQENNMASAPHPDPDKDSPSPDDDGGASAQAPLATELDLAIDHGSEHELVVDAGTPAEPKATEKAGGETAPPPGPAGRA
jgi:hypothetical protein